MAKLILLVALVSLSLFSTACITTGADGKTYDCTGVPVRWHQHPVDRHRLRARAHRATAVSSGSSSPVGTGSRGWTVDSGATL
jgi:hypothetical protein